MCAWNASIGRGTAPSPRTGRRRARRAARAAGATWPNSALAIAARASLSSRVGRQLGVLGQPLERRDLAVRDRRRAGRRPPRGRRGPGSRRGRRRAEDSVMRADVPIDWRQRAALHRGAPFDASHGSLPSGAHVRGRPHVRGSSIDSPESAARTDSHGSEPNIVTTFRELGVSPRSATRSSAPASPSRSPSRR